MSRTRWTTTAIVDVVSDVERPAHARLLGVDEPLHDDGETRLEDRQTDRAPGLQRAWMKREREQPLHALNKVAHAERGFEHAGERVDLDGVADDAGADGEGVLVGERAAQLVEPPGQRGRQRRAQDRARHLLAETDHHRVVDDGGGGRGIDGCGDVARLQVLVEGVDDDDAEARHARLQGQQLAERPALRADAGGRWWHLAELARQEHDGILRLHPQPESGVGSFFIAVAHAHSRPRSPSNRDTTLAVASTSGTTRR